MGDLDTGMQRSTHSPLILDIHLVDLGCYPVLSSGGVKLFVSPPTKKLP
jgi:hypothetical protein